MKKLLLCALLAILSGCNAIEKATYRQIDVPDFSFDFDALLTGNTLANLHTLSEGYVAFSVDQTFSISDSEFRSTVYPYRGLLRDVEIGAANISCTARSGGSDVSLELTITADERILLTRQIDNYALDGSPIALSSGELDRLESATKEFIQGSPIDIQASGVTDASGERLSFSILLTGISVTAGLDL